MYLRIWTPCLEYLAYSNSHCMHFGAGRRQRYDPFVYCNGSSKSNGEAWRGELMKSSDQMCYRCSSILTAEEKTFCLFSHLSIEIDEVSSRVRKHLLCLHWFWSLTGWLACLRSSSTRCLHSLNSLWWTLLSSYSDQSTFTFLQHW